jgi:hypothetical protein
MTHRVAGNCRVTAEVAHSPEDRNECLKTTAGSSAIFPFLNTGQDAECLSMMLVLEVGHDTTLIADDTPWKPALDHRLV